MRVNINKFKKYAEEAWNNPETIVLFQLVYKTFNDYWDDIQKEVCKYGTMSAEEQQEYYKSGICQLDKKIEICSVY